MGNLIASAGNKKDMETMINEYYYSTSYIILEDGKIRNTKSGKVLDGVHVVQKNRRWRFESI